MTEEQLTETQTEAAPTPEAVVPDEVVAADAAVLEETAEEPPVVPEVEIDPDEGPVELPELLERATLNALVDEAVADVAVPLYEVVTAKVTAVGDDFITLAIGADHSADVNRDEFTGPDGSMSATVGGEVEVYVEGVEGDIVDVSKEIADRLAAWDRLESLAKSGDILQGRVTGASKGGLDIDVGYRAFMPASQVDLRGGGNLDGYVGQTFDVSVIRFERKTGKVIVSRRAILEKEREGLKEETIQKLIPGAVVEGIVKNLTEFGAFVDLGGIDGLLHVTDMSWSRITHPKQAVTSGQEITVQVLGYEPEKERVSLGLKQLMDDPWASVSNRYAVGQRLEGKVVSLAEYGAFVEIEGGIEGLIHVSEMSWTKRISHPREVLKKGQTTEAQILGIDEDQRRISLGLKQLQPNPWEQLRDTHSVGTKVKGTIKSVTNFGVFVGVAEGIDGLVHVSDLSWTGEIKDPQDHFKAGDEMEAMILHIDVGAERLSLGIKQMQDDPWTGIEARYPLGLLVEGTVKKILDFGAIIELEPNVEGMIHISELSEDRVESVGDVLEQGASTRAKVISLDPDARKMGLSIKRLVEAETEGDVSDFQQAAPVRTTIGDLITKKMDVSSLPPGPNGD